MATTEHFGLDVEERLRRPPVPSASEIIYQEEMILEGFPGREEMVAKFHEIWGRIEEHLAVNLTSDQAVELFKEMVLYDIPDGTRSTLTVRPDLDVGMDAAMYCVALVHTLRSLGAESCVIMTHTSYNRLRGQEGLDRILRIIERGSRPLKKYAETAGVNVHWVGMRPGYELHQQLLQNFPVEEGAAFESYFLIDYAEDLISNPDVRRDLERIPNVDVCIRHTKLNLSGGGWIPEKLLRSTFLYSQNGTLFSNWDFDEFVALAICALLAKVLNSGEGLVKMYGDLDEVKRRYQLREQRLFNQRIELRPDPSKLFVFGSALGLHQVYY